MWPDRTLTLHGRPADVLNLGGVKVSAVELDAAARSHDAVSDACSLLLDTGGAGPRLAIAAVCDLDAGGKLAAHVRSVLPMSPPFCILCVASIPRGSMGKVNRMAFAAAIERALAGPQPDSGDRVTMLGPF